MSYLNGKIIWITGASSGIGEAITKEMSKYEVKLIISSRRREALERVRSQCSNPQNIEIFPLDLAKNSQAEQWVEKAWEIFGRIDILINNGGVGQWGKALDTKEEVERQLFEVNYFGNVALTKHILPLMEAQGSGQVVAVSSLAGHFGQANLAAYSAAKGALLLYYESLKEEIRQTGLKLQVISPGFINTNVMFNSLTPDGSTYDKNGPAQEKGMPPEIFARKLIKIISGKKFHSYIGRKELLAVPLHFFSPGLFYSLLRKE